MSEEDYSAQKMQALLLEHLPHNEEDAFSSKDLGDAIPTAFLLDSNGILKRERVAKNLQVLFVTGQCKRVFRFMDGENARDRFYYWKGEPVRKTYHESSLLSEQIKEILQQKGYSIDIEANTPFVDLVYTYKAYKKTVGHSKYAEEFTKWFLHEIKYASSHEIHLHNIKRLAKTVNFLVRQSSQVKGKTYQNKKVEEIPSFIPPDHNPQSRAEPLREYLLRSLPRTEDQAVTSKEFAFSCHIPHREKQVSNMLYQLCFNNAVMRTLRKPHRYWVDSHLSKPNLGSVITKEEHTNVIPLQFLNSNQSILARIKAVENDIVQIHERYAKIEGVLEEKELNAKLQKLEQSKDKEQEKLNHLEEQLRTWNTDDLKVRTGILK